MISLKGIFYVIGIFVKVEGWKLNILGKSLGMLRYEWV